MRRTDSEPVGTPSGKTQVSTRGWASVKAKEVVNFKIRVVKCEPSIVTWVLWVKKVRQSHSLDNHSLHRLKRAHLV